MVKQPKVNWVKAAKPEKVDESPSDESCESRGPYYLVYGTTPEELEANVNELLREWPLPHWAFLGYWRDGDCYYRELLKMPADDLPGGPIVFWPDIGEGGYDA